MLRAIILEGDEDSSKLLQRYLKDYCPHVQPLAVVNNIARAYDAFQNHHPDFALLDLKIPGGSVFNLLEKLQPIGFDIIFTSSDEEFMLRAFHLSAVDYLMKPINVDELRAAVEKVKRRHEQVEKVKQFELLMNNIKASNVDHKIVVSATDGNIFVKISDIIYLESEGSYTHFHLKQNKKLLASKNIKEYEDLLASHNFFRIHKSHIVNVAEIQKYARGERISVVMSNEKELEVSRRRKDGFLGLLHQA